MSKFLAVGGGALSHGPSKENLVYMYIIHIHIIHIYKRALQTGFYIQ